MTFKVHQSQNLLIKNENGIIRVKLLSLSGAVLPINFPVWNEITVKIYLWVFIFKTNVITIYHITFWSSLNVERREDISKSTELFKNPFVISVPLIMTCLMTTRRVCIVSWDVYGWDITNQQRKSINSLTCSSSGAQYIIIYVRSKTKPNLFTLLVLGRAWLPTHPALLKVTVGRTLLWVRPTAEPGQPSTSEPVRIPQATKLRNYRNLPTACKLLLLVCDSHSASDLLSRSIRPSLRHWDWRLHLRKDKHLNHSFCAYLNCAAK